MVSIGPYSQSYNFTHMYDFGDLRSCKQSKSKSEYCPHSLMGIINSHPEFQKFNHMVIIAKLDHILNEPQANFTLFVPSDTSIDGLGNEIFLNMDDGTARHIVMSSMLDYKIPSEILESSPASYFITKDPPNRLFIGNISGKTFINDDINVIHKNILASNGIIHVIDKLIWPYMI